MLAHISSLSNDKEVGMTLDFVAILIPLFVCFTRAASCLCRAYIATVCESTCVVNRMQIRCTYVHVGLWNWVVISACVLLVNTNTNIWLKNTVDSQNNGHFGTLTSVLYWDILF